jgi:hypothetical protein
MLVHLHLSLVNLLIIIVFSCSIDFILINVAFIHLHLSLISLLITIVFSCSIDFILFSISFCAFAFLTVSFPITIVFSCSIDFMLKYDAFVHLHLSLVSLPITIVSSCSIDFILMMYLCICICYICVGAARSIDAELHFWFPSQPVMDAMGIVFPQFWRDEHADESFFKHLAVLKAHFCQNKTVTGWKHMGDMNVPGLLRPEALDAQHAMFRMAMKTNWSTSMSRPFSVNPLTRIWQQLGANTILLAGFPEYFKLAEIAIVLVLGSVEDERTFSTLGFVKSKVRNKLIDHLALCVQMYTQKFWNLQTFPFNEAIGEWMSIKPRYGLDPV